MSYIVEETLIPQAPTGSVTKSFLAEDREELKTIITTLYETRNQMKGFSFDSVEFFGKLNGDGYVEAYLDDEAPYSSWSVVWKINKEDAIK